MEVPGSGAEGTSALYCVQCKVGYSGKVVETTLSDQNTAT